MLIFPFTRVFSRGRAGTGGSGAGTWTCGTQSVGTFRAWQDGQVALFDLVWAALRASIVLLVLGFYLR